MKDFKFEFESKQGEFENITTMLWYVLEDYYTGVKKDDLYKKANYYDRLEPFLYNIHELLYLKQKEMQEMINEKEGATNER